MGCARGEDVCVIGALINGIRDVFERVGELEERGRPFVEDGGVWEDRGRARAVASLREEPDELERAWAYPFVRDVGTTVCVDVVEREEEEEEEDVAGE